LHATSTDTGIAVVITPLHPHAKASIRCNFEFESSVTDANDGAMVKATFAHNLN
jgi:hypothetical protein